MVDRATNDDLKLKKQSKVAPSSERSGLREVQIPFLTKTKVMSVPWQLQMWCWCYPLWVWFWVTPKSFSKPWFRVETRTYTHTDTKKVRDAENEGRRKEKQDRVTKTIFLPSINHQVWLYSFQHVVKQAIFATSPPTELCFRPTISQLSVYHEKRFQMLHENPR